MRTLLFISSIILSFNSFAIERGINYDPAHSKNFVKAQANNNLQGMKSEVIKDLEVLKNSGFNNIKTFYSSLSTIDGQKLFTIAELACPRNFKVMLGVYEFRNPEDKCDTWCKIATKTQVEKAIESVKAYPGCITAIAVGNEDAYNWNFTQPNKEVQQRIANDISTIKQGIGNTNTLVGSAQQDGAWIKLSQSDPYNIIGKADFLGVNIYPFWSAQKPTQEASHSEFMARYKAIKNNAKLGQKVVIVTEEGWPSKSSSTQNPNASIESQRAYYKWWLSRATSDDFDSYYFAIFDKQPTNADADKYFGLCEEDRRNKILMTCQ